MFFLAESMFLARRAIEETERARKRSRAMSRLETARQIQEVSRMRYWHQLQCAGYAVTRMPEANAKTRFMVRQNA